MATGKSNAIGGAAANTMVLKSRTDSLCFVDADGVLRQGSGGRGDFTIKTPCLIVQAASGCTMGNFYFSTFAGIRYAVLTWQPILYLPTGYIIDDD